VALAVALWLLLLPVYLRWRRRRNDRGWSAWVELTSERETQYRLLRDEIARRVGDIGESCDLARRRHERGDETDALRVLAAIVDVIEAFVPDLVGRLREWARVAWALERVPPLQPVSPRVLRVGRVKGVAAAWAALDALLVGTRERFRLRAFMLRYALRLVASGMRELVHGQKAPAARWQRVEALRDDLDTLSDASLETFRGLLVSLQLRLPATA